MKNKTSLFLLSSLIITVAVFGFVFFAMIDYTRDRNSEMISSVGELYMQGLNERISMHFETIFGLRLSSAEQMIQLEPGDSFSDYDEAAKTIARNSRVRGFDSAAFYLDGTIDTIFGPESSLVVPERFERVISSGNSLVTMGRMKDDTYILLIGVPGKYPMKDGQRSEAVIVGLSVDFIKQVLSLDRNDDSLVYSQVIRGDGTFVLDDDKVYDTYFDRLLDKVADDIEDKTPEDYINEMKEAIASNSSYSTTYRMKTGSTGQFYFTPITYTEWYLITFLPYGELNEKITELNGQWVLAVLVALFIMIFVLVIDFAIYFNMTRKQLKNLEAARAEAVHATKAKSEFLSNMSHDIRTPMNAIVGMTAIATANIDDKQQVQNCLNKITLSSKHLLGLINDILDMSKIESGKMTLNMEQISLREVMDSIVNIVQPQVKAKSQHFDVFIYDIINEDVYCDSVRINQVLINLLSNAVKFTPDGGTIHVSLYEEECPENDNFVRVHLRVKDNGAGMSPEFKEQVFEAFMREDKKRVHKTEGTGLGMAITKYIVDAMGGTIECESEQGKGTEFHVTVDLEKALVRTEDMVLPDWNMLVVDDDEQLCRTAIVSLKDIGINAESVLDGETAVKKVRERHEKNDDYQIVLLDWKLPGIDGIETARRIRREVGDDVPILLISAYDWSEIEAEAKEAGICGFISKPLFKSTLYYGLKQFLLPESAGEEKVSQESQFDLNGKRILLAEDNDLNWEIAEALLGSMGMVLDHAENGKICVEKFIASEEGFYDAILMDIRMPVMTGIEAAAEIRALDRGDKDIPIIAMTADAFAEDVKKCLDCGMNAHVAKPIDVNEVAKMLEKYIKKGE